jgi:hypothetical protein
LALVRYGAQTFGRLTITVNVTTGVQVIRGVIGRKSVPRPFENFVHGLTSLFGSKEAFTFCISCFCSSQDANDMWEDYALRGTGFGIVFDSKILLRGCDGGRAYSFAPVIYDEGVQIAKTSEIIDHAIQLKRKWNLPKRVLMDYWCSEVVFYLLTCGFRFKAPRWRHEQEVRIAVPERDGLKPFDCAGRTRVEVPFEQCAVIGVVRGPNAGADAVERVRQVLIRAGYGDDLLLS